MNTDIRAKHIPSVSVVNSLQVRGLKEVEVVKRVVASPSMTEEEEGFRFRFRFTTFIIHK
jgi:hypothetical protein